MHKTDYQKLWYKKNRERILIARKQYNFLHKEKICEYKKEWNQANKEKIKQYWITNKERKLLNKARERAKNLNLEFNIEESDVIIPKFCPLLGTEIKLDNSIQSYDSPTIDRINNNLGYVKGNIQVICWRANDLKKNASLDELKKLYCFIKTNQSLCSTYVSSEKWKKKVRNLLWDCKTRSRKFSIENNLTKETIERICKNIPTVCPILGIALKLNFGKRSFDSISIDRINPKEGYTENNIMLISWRANEIKKDVTLEELEKLITNLEIIYNENRKTL